MHICAFCSPLLRYVALHRKTHELLLSVYYCFGPMIMLFTVAVSGPLSLQQNVPFTGTMFLVKANQGK